MATAPDGASRAPAPRKFDIGALARTASWGIGAAAALFLAVLAGMSETGTRRLTTASAPPTATTPQPLEKSAALQVLAPKPVVVTHIQAPPRPEPAPQPAPQPEPQVQAQVQIPPEPGPETTRLQEQVRLLLADQDRLLQRISALERSLDDVTGSIRRQEAEAKRIAAERAAQPAAAPSGPVSTVSWPAIIAAISTSGPWPEPSAADAGPETTASIPPETPLPHPRPNGDAEPSATAAAPQVAPVGPPPQTKPSDAKPSDAKPADTAQADGKPAEVKEAEAKAAEPPPARRIAHGIDLGGASSVDRLRTMWRGLQLNEGTLLQGLRPLAFMSGTRRGKPDVRLIAGPIATSSEASKLCSALLNAGRYCEPAVFTGHRLTSR